MEKKASLSLLCDVQHSVIMADFFTPDRSTTAYYSYYFSYLLFLLFKGSCMNIFQIQQLLLPVSM